MGFEFSHGGTGYLHKSVIQGTTGDFIWQSYDSSWTNIFEIKIASGTVDFNERPTHDGSQLALLSEVGDSYYSKVARNGFSAMTQRETLRLIAGNQVTIDQNDDSINDESEITFNVSDGSGSGLDADTLDTYHATSFARKAENVAVTGTWNFTAPITLDGATTGNKAIKFVAASLAFDRSMGLQFYNDTTPLHKQVIQITTGDLFWQSYVGGTTWTNAFEIRVADAVTNFWQRPEYLGTQLALTSEITGDSYYSIFRRDGLTAMTQRTTMHWTGGTGIDITAVDDSGNDETDITISIDSTVPSLTADETVTGSWTFNDNSIYIENGSYTGFLNYGSTVDTADHLALWSLENASGTRIWSMQKSATTTNLRLNRTASLTKVWEIGLTTGIMDFNEVPTVDGVDIPTVGATTITGTWTFNADTYVDNANLYIREPADTARAKLQRANNTLASPTAVTAGNWIGDYQRRLPVVRL
jgi:hypothetical protein